MATTLYPPPHDLRLILHQALAEPIGLLIWTSNPVLAREKFNSARKGDPLLAEIQIKLVDFGQEGNMVLVKRAGGANTSIVTHHEESEEDV